MKIKYKFTLSVLIFYCIFSACSSKKEMDTKLEEKILDSISDARSETKAFWESYRTAQKRRVKEEWQEAAEAYEKALKIKPNHEDSWFNLGNMYLELNQGKKSEVCWRKIVEQNPNSARAHMQLGRLYLSYERSESFDLEKAELEFSIASNVNKVITGPLMQLGYVALIKGEKDQANSYLKSVTVTDTKSVEPHFLLGYVAWKNGATSTAQKHFGEAISLAVANQQVEGPLSEGDTKDGKSLLRSINQSIFYEFFQDLSDISEDKLSIQINNRYKNLEIKLNEIRSK